MLLEKSPPIAGGKFVCWSRKGHQHTAGERGRAPGVQHSQLPGNCFTVQFPPAPAVVNGYVFFQQCCRVASFAGQRGCPPRLPLRASLRLVQGQAVVLLLPPLGCRGCSASAQAGPFSVSPTWGGRKRGVGRGETVHNQAESQR